MGDDLRIKLSDKFSLCRRYGDGNGLLGYSLVEYLSNDGGGIVSIGDEIYFVSH